MGHVGQVGERFGPVLAVLPLGADDQGFAPAGDSPYGPAASARTRDVRRVEQVMHDTTAVAGTDRRRTVFADR
jgi:acyl-CoA reductase-like NAD-dependent aldehyde dehydrogenase